MVLCFMLMLQEKKEIQNPDAHDYNPIAMNRNKASKNYLPISPNLITLGHLVGQQM